MNLNLNDKSVLVMASSDGIGKGIAQEFCAEGAKVMLFGRNEDRLVSAQAEIEDATGRRPEYTVGDLTNPGDIEAAVANTVNRVGSLYALINNSGGPRPGGFDQFDDEAWQEAFELTLLNYVRATRAAVEQMRAAGGGRIVNIASSSVKVVIDNLLLSNVFRMGMVGLTKSLARDLGSEGILINLLGPGKITTGRSAQIDENKAAALKIPVEEWKKKSAEQIPLGRYGSTEEFARMAVFLCSEANGYVTGQSFLIDGGMVAAY